jgi:hypothetical protein
VQAIGDTLTLQNQSSIRDRLQIPAADLTIGLLWLLYGVYSRPDDGQVSREIMLRVLPLTNDHQARNLLFHPSENRNDNPPIPHCPYGVVYLDNLRWPEVCSTPRLAYRDGTALSDRCYQAYFSMSYKELYHSKVKTGFAVLPTNYINSRKGRTRPHRNTNPESLPGLADLAIALPRPGFDVGDDLPVEEMVLPEPEEDSGTMLTKLWLRFLTDIMQKCGNERGGTSYCRLTMEERESVTPEMFQDPDLSKVFWKVQWKQAERRDLAKTFGMYWPDENHVLPHSSQNFKQTQWYPEWKNMVADLPSSAVVKLRQALFKEFLSLAWIPVPLSDRIWSYNPDISYHRLPKNLPKNARAPRVLFLKAGGPSWDLEDGNVGEQFVEEEPPRQGLQNQYQSRQMDRYELREEEEESSDSS